MFVFDLLFLLGLRVTYADFCDDGVSIEDGFSKIPYSSLRLGVTCGDIRTTMLVLNMASS